MTMADSPTPATADVHTLDVHLPSEPSERGAWLLAGLVGFVGVAVLVAVLTGLVGQTSSARAALPPVVPVAATTPTPSPSSTASVLAGAGVGTAARKAGAQTRAAPANGHSPSAIVAQPSRLQQNLEAQRFVDHTQTHIYARWMEGFYPIYAVAQRTFGVNWLLLASIHMQESAFSTAPGIYHGLNFAGCCGGPMQFNVTNSTWQLVSNSYLYGKRPAHYNHMTATHPSIYDDFDAIMAAAHLLSADGAESALDGAAWDAAYDYYGHDATGVSYADEVLARAIGWSQHGFCINCGVEPAMVEAVHAAYGAPVLAALTTATTARKPRPATASGR
jgi:hypothetical protein